MTIDALTAELLQKARLSITTGQYTERELAGHLRCTREWTCKLLSGRYRPSYRLLLRLAAILNTNITDLIRGARLEALRTPLLRPSAQPLDKAPTHASHTSLRVIDDEELGQ